jgi:type IV pilus assembly protein PilY1
LALFVFILPRTEAALPLSDVPLFLATAVDPNIIFTLDDSGSMQFEIMPDNLIPSTASTNAGDVRFVYPVRAGTYGGGTYGNYVVGFDGSDFDSNNQYTAMLRSSHINTIYYDPAVRYLPWSHADGSLMSDANPTCAPHNPWPMLGKNNPTQHCRDLTKNNKEEAYWLTSNRSATKKKRSFYPAVYYQYNGSGSVDSYFSYTKVEIKSGNTYAGGPERTDCVDSSVCTYAEEIQNFANWYTYYRSRILLARAGAGRAFAAQGSNMRVAFGAINEGNSKVDGVDTETLITGVRQFAGENRDGFFNKLYQHTIPVVGTPLRKAMQNVGEYLKRSDDMGPWSDTPGENGGTQPACRQNYHVLMTDGFWNGENPIGIDNEDNADGVTHINHTSNITPATYQYTPALPYMDSYSKTLADVAMYYWKNDLRSDMPNKVPTNAKDPAFWQHMINFTIGLGVEGELSSLPGSANGPTAWPGPTSKDAYKIDDLWHAAVNSRGEFFSAQDPMTFTIGLTNALANITTRVSSAAAVTTNTSRLNANTQIYQAKFNSADWSGQLLAFNLEADTSLGELQWEASEQLPTHTSRKIFTHNGTTSLTFTADKFSLFSTEQQTALNTDLDLNLDELGLQRLAWLRGDQKTEVGKSGTLRKRNNGVLGDIVNSDLLHVQSLDFGYDSLPPGTAGRTTYHAYRQTNSSRIPIVYTGANDGMLHAFNAQTGKELFAYIPSAIYLGLSQLTAPDYTHRYLVDGNAYAGDAYIGSTWKTVLLGTLGGGGKSVFALNITDPVNFSTSDVMWEFTDPDLGFVHGQAKIARLNDNSWAAIISNGYNSTSDKAYLFIVDLQTGTLIQKIPTNNSVNNGLSTPALVDINGDKIIDVVYAGDLQGNIWKFDLSDSNSSNWKVAGGANQPLFTAKNTNNDVQPITSPLEVGYHKQGGYMIFFGTGQFIATGDVTDTKVQSLYGIWDNGSPITVTDRSVLQQQTIGIDPPFRTISNHVIDWTARRGWYIDLQLDGIKKGERSVIMPMLNFGRVVFTTLIPSTDDPCEAGGRNWLMLLNAENGGMKDIQQFDTNYDGKINNEDRKIAGVSSDGIRSDSVAISDNSLTHLVAGTTTGAIENVAIRNVIPPPRRSWRQLQ